MNTQIQAARSPLKPSRGRGVNITPVERVGRILLGTAATIAGILLLTSAATTVAVVLAILLAASGLDLVVTGAIGRCPLYRKLGYTPKSLRN
ncbi:MAG: DUF2892 domain-containing protein [Ilumatobacteraceae bacterium]